mgnify:CR=1 FL=1
MTVSFLTVSFFDVSFLSCFGNHVDLDSAALGNGLVCWPSPARDRCRSGQWVGGLRPLPYSSGPHVPRSDRGAGLSVRCILNLPHNSNPTDSNDLARRTRRSYRLPEQADLVRPGSHPSRAVC